MTSRNKNLHKTIRKPYSYGCSEFCNCNRSNWYLLDKWDSLECWEEENYDIQEAQIAHDEWLFKKTKISLANIKKYEEIIKEIEAGTIEFGPLTKSGQEKLDRWRKKGENRT